MEKETSIMIIKTIRKKQNNSTRQIINRNHKKETSPTNSTGNTEHFFAMVTFLSGAAITAFGTIC